MWPLRLTSCQDRVAITPQLADEMGSARKKGPKPHQAGWAGQGPGFPIISQVTHSCDYAQVCLCPETVDSRRAENPFSTFLPLTDMYWAPPLCQTLGVQWWVRKTQPCPGSFSSVVTPPASTSALHQAWVSGGRKEHDRVVPGPQRTKW